jgi:hypothetical protein
MGPAAGLLNAVRKYRVTKEGNLVDYRSNCHVVKKATPPACPLTALQQNALLIQCTLTDIFQKMSLYLSQ